MRAYFSATPPQPCLIFGITPALECAFSTCIRLRIKHLQLHLNNDIALRSAAHGLRHPELC
jgi:hypothetical protein